MHATTALVADPGSSPQQANRRLVAGKEIPLGTSLALTGCRAVSRLMYPVLAQPRETPGSFAG